MIVPQLPGRAELHTLDNGLRVCLLHNPQAPVVTTALWYAAGSRDEVEGHGGAAHFLEHMMFKGSAAYGPGEVDRRTQALGGSNNAFTSFDATAYYFNFARDRWTEALAIEADRMATLTLDAKEVDSERQVILEEVTMYEDDPWEALDKDVRGVLYSQQHAYGKPVIGTRPELLATGPEELRDFHQRWYRPDNAVLVLAGDLEGGDLEAAGDADALAAVQRHLGSLPQRATERSACPPPPRPSSLQRLERRQGDVERMLLGLPAVPWADERYPRLDLLAALLSEGRSSRLHRALVDEAQLCSWVSADVTKSSAAGMFSVALELLPGADRARAEALVLEQLATLRQQPVSAEELQRAQQMLVADWVFHNEKLHQQALAVGFALVMGAGERHQEQQLRRLIELDAEQLCETAAAFLDPQAGGVLGWSLAEGEVTA